MDKKGVTLQVLATPGCVNCKLFEEFWHTIEKDWPNVAFQHIEATTPEGQEMIGKYMVFASPGIILNGELFATGGFDKKKFIQQLQKISQ